MSDDRERVATEAFRLFAEQGYDTTTIDDIASAAGISRSTFFRAYGTKEAVIFPDHDRILARVEDRLKVADGDSALVAVTEAVREVLLHYLGEGDRARERYRLTSSVPSLRERELVSGARYQRLFRRYLSEWGDQSDASESRAEIMSAAVVAAHNRVLRRWLRGEIDDPRREVTTALAMVQRLFSPGDDAGIVPPMAVVVVPAGVDMSRVAAAVRDLADSNG